jgi:hypothetical protein
MQLAGQGRDLLGQGRNLFGSVSNFGNVNKRARYDAQ